MKNIVLFVLMFNCACSMAQEKIIAGTYFMEFGQKGYQGCCAVREVVRLNTDHTFSYYRNYDQGDYQSEAMSYGTYKVIRDSVLFLSNTPYPNGMIKCLPYNDSIGDNTTKISFAQHYDTVEGFINNDYYSVDDSLNMSKLEIIKTFPKISTLFDTIFNEYKYNYQKNQSIKEFTVYLEKSKIKNLLIFGNNENVNICIAPLNITKQFLLTNDIYIDLGKQNTPFYFDCSGYRFAVGTKGLASLKPVDNGAGTKSDNVKYKKLSEQNFDSLIIVSFRDDILGSQQLIIKKDRSVQYSYSSYNTEKKSYDNEKKEIVLNEEKYKKFIEELSVSPIYQVDTNNIHKNSLGKMSGVKIYFNGTCFENWGGFLSTSLYQFLFHTHIGEK